MPSILELPTAPASSPSGLLIIDLSGVTYSITLSNLLQVLGLTAVQLQTALAGFLLPAAGGFSLSDTSGAALTAPGTGSLNIGSGVAQDVTLQAGGQFSVYAGGGLTLQAGVDPDAQWATRLFGALDCGFIEGVVSGTPGLIVGKVPIRDGSGTMIGFLPVYDGIT